MGELAKATRLLHQLLIGVCATVMVFALTSDRADTYRAALAEITALRSLDHVSYVHYALRRLEDRRNELARFDARAGTPEAKDRPVHYAVVPETFIDWPADDASVGAVVLFYEGAAKAVQYGPGDDAEVTKLKAAALGDASQPDIPAGAVLRQTIFHAPSQVPRVKLARDRYLARELTPTERSGNLELSFVRETPDESTDVSRYGGPVTVTTEYTVSDNLPRAWLETQPMVLAKISTEIDGKRVLLPASKDALTEVEGFDLTVAARVLQDKLDTMKREITVFGISIEERIAVWAGPAVLLAVCLYLCAHLMQLRVRSAATATDVPWIATFPGVLSAVIAYGSIVAAPVVAALLLLRRSAHGAHLTTFVGATLTTGVVVAAVACGWHVARIRAAVAAHDVEQRTAAGVDVIRVEDAGAGADSTS